jgi:hypothetical protein
VSLYLNIQTVHPKLARKISEEKRELQPSHRYIHPIGKFGHVKETIEFKSDFLT